ncbi:hypothetical protein MLD38_021580 [Melastoma candidum]|uniref:Uncharacterized protein n=1 Tax=Melastoma candidum TaxID=119954 RepID=A0ACB9QFR9_9MYRT|nr:hypothetical protein MLD38_021580 [Melastoma candidum]
MGSVEVFIAQAGHTVVRSPLVQHNDHVYESDNVMFIGVAEDDARKVDHQSPPIEQKEVLPKESVSSTNQAKSDSSEDLPKSGFAKGDSSIYSRLTSIWNLSTNHADWTTNYVLRAL